MLQGMLNDSSRACLQHVLVRIARDSYPVVTKPAKCILCGLESSSTLNGNAWLDTHFSVMTQSFF
jgi:hypothetical protein